MKDNTSGGTRAEIRRFIDDNNLLKTGDKVVVALSGGADSVALLHILISFKEEYDLTIQAAHFHHGIRGAEADRDADFVKALCRQWDVELHFEQADVPALAAESGESVELVARELRYRFFKKAAGDAKIATAHHGDDNAETVLWNLTRGAGIGGLCGIPVQRGNIIRPLLCSTRARIEAYCRDNHLEYVNDSTNLSDDYTRNRLRHHVTPVLRELNPYLSETIGRTSALLRETDDYLNHISDIELNKAKTPHGYACEPLLRLDPIVLKYAVKNVLENAAAPVDFQHIALIIEAMRCGSAVELGQGFTAVCAQGTLRVIHDNDADQRSIQPVVFSEYIKTHGKRITLRGGIATDSDGNVIRINNLLLNNAIPCDIITSDIVFRTRRAGDTFTDARRGVTKTLKKLMNELKIPREERDRIPVAANGSVILWMSGYGTSAQAKIDVSRDGELIWLMGDNHA